MTTPTTRDGGTDPYDAMARVRQGLGVIRVKEVSGIPQAHTDRVFRVLSSDHQAMVERIADLEAQLAEVRGERDVYRTALMDLKKHHELIGAHLPFSTSLCIISDALARPHAGEGEDEPKI